MFRRFAALIIVISISAVLSGCTDRRVPSGGTTAPDFTLQDLNGKKVRLSDYKGKVVLLDFWATWCPPCRASIPGLEKIHKAYKDKGLVLLAISLDQGEWDSVKAFSAEYGITYTVLEGNEDVSDKYQVRTIPMLLVINKEGRISKRYLGFGNDEDLEGYIRSIL